MKPQFRILDIILLGALVAVIIVNVQQEAQLRRQQMRLNVQEKRHFEMLIEQGRVLNDLAELQLQSAAVHNRLEAHTAGSCVHTQACGEESLRLAP